MNLRFDVCLLVAFWNLDNLWLWLRFCWLDYWFGVWLFAILAFNCGFCLFFVECCFGGFLECFWMCFGLVVCCLIVVTDYFDFGVIWVVSVLVLSLRVFDIWLVVAIVIDRILATLGLFVCVLDFLSWFVVLLFIIVCVLILLLFAVCVWIVVYLLLGFFALLGLFMC